MFWSLYKKQKTSMKSSGGGVQGPLRAENRCKDREYISNNKVFSEKVEKRWKLLVREIGFL